MLIKKVKTLAECRHLMRVLENNMPDLRWMEGQKPTQWHPSEFPSQIYISNREHKLCCYDN